ncbi:hypothetical protein CLAIMM_11975 [Cladophialophora immunda]|nr:hypothetical protein CLAIMM_11975 [Cladophialophora immunda]
MSRRRQSTSCQPCRKARIGCDAILRKGDPCTNCVRRAKVCCPQQAPCEPQQALSPSGAGQHPLTAAAGDNGLFTASPSGRFPPITETRFDAGDVLLTPRTQRSAGSIAGFCARQLHDSAGLLSPIRSISYFDLEDNASRRLQALALHDILWDIFISIFESRFALWLGDSCCPYLEMTMGTKALVSSIVLQLDADTSSGIIEADVTPSTCDLRASQVSGRHFSDPLLNDALRYTIYAYSARWLPLKSAYELHHVSDSARSTQMQQEIRDQLWYQARSALMPALSRPSYRSILALSLFTFMEMPLENGDPGFGRLCSQVLYTQFDRLRSPFKDGATLPLSQTTSAIPDERYASDSVLARAKGAPCEKRQNLEDSIYWLGVLMDVSRSLIHRLPMVMLPGQLGDRKIWDFIRQRTVIFDLSFKVLHGSQVPLQPDVVAVVLQHASACKTMYLGTLNRFCDAMGGHRVEDLEDAAKQIAEEIGRFHDVFDPLLAMCFRDYMDMSSENQLNYLLLIAHYHLGSLILANTIESLKNVPDQLEEPAVLRQQACNAIVQTLSLVMSCDRYSCDDSPYGSRLLHDPTPELMVEVLARAGRAVLCLHETSKTSLQAAQIMLSVIFSALNIISQISVVASFVKAHLRQIAAGQNIRIQEDPLRPMSAPSHHADVLSKCNAKSIESFLQESQIQTMLDPWSLEKTVRSYDKSGSVYGLDAWRERQF